MASPPLILEIQTGKHKGKRVRLTESELIVGRGEEARIRISSAEVSRQHCKLIPQERGILVVDLNSRNGTFVDGRPVNGQRLLSPGGTLTVGPLTFLLLGAGGTVVPRQPAVALTGKVRTSDSLSDDEIADWLSDDELPTTNPDSPTETRIIKNTPAEAPVEDRPASDPAVQSSLSPSTPVQRKREFKSIAEEAKDIIRRHFESLKQSEQD